jgi:hypothetical protein
MYVALKMLAELVPDLEIGSSIPSFNKKEIWV